MHGYLRRFQSSDRQFSHPAYTLSLTGSKSIQHGWRPPPRPTASPGVRSLPSYKAVGPTKWTSSSRAWQNGINTQRPGSGRFFMAETLHRRKTPSESNSHPSLCNLFPFSVHHTPCHLWTASSNGPLLCSHAASVYFLASTCRPK